LIIVKPIITNILIAKSCPISTPRLNPKRAFDKLSSENPISNKNPPKPNQLIKPKIEAINNEKRFEKFLETKVM